MTPFFLEACAIALWVSLAMLAYTIVAYPLLIAALAKIRARRVHARSIEPFVSVVIAAHNEEARIARKVANVLALRHPAHLIEVLVGSDGSTDRTADIVRAISDARVRVFDFPERRGKPAILNALVPAASGEIVLLADVRQMFHPKLLASLLPPFGDASVGAVSGELVFTETGDSTSIATGAGAYWKYEKFMRTSESRVHSTSGATGAVYAIRKELFTPIPEDTLLDDVLIPMQIVRRGFRVLLENGALAFDVPAARGADEFTRKVRTLAGNFQLFSREPWMLVPFVNPICWQTVSHKVLRLVMPLFQVTAFAANVVLARHAAGYATLLTAQLAFYAAALIGSALRDGSGVARLFSLPYMFSLLSWATVVAFARWLSGAQSVIWTQAGTVAATAPERRS